ncbi:hypothetical protein SAMN05660841_00340 [Sphingobacterium nematocida]|uniref:Uncharacterized protein n=1 Tax=Sphingobacterium nematocida TaxID=1513896 RepID=A0A1T5B182_9SPHI|nr:hypothetical protein [Sphingobacterium nematocida]SKB40623.1 hypothetical protein SAMN05660841_00340 [Sphingobacterium nematocida]
MDETEVFIENITEIISKLNLSKSSLNKKFGWPLNKLTFLLNREQSLLLEDVTTVRKALGLTTSDLLVNILNKSEIEKLLVTLNDCVKKKNTGQANSKDSPIDYLIIILSKKYIKDSTFTKKGLLKDMPAKYDNYKIEWDKNRLKNYIERVEKTGKTELTFKLSSSLPDDIIETSVSAVDSDWLKEFEEKVKKSNG